ncbi:hypothetical protein [Dechloromonas denitrificans]|uniref:hypothetical protein n=1 Tax=Dechloromonas denitrificans TaxID=281362 RepID=UPI0012F9B8A0|nr:hypothetical protein [Dechloromonas denitrificans]
MTADEMRKALREAGLHKEKEPFSLTKLAGDFVANLEQGSRVVAERLEKEVSEAAEGFQRGYSETRARHRAEAAAEKQAPFTFECSCGQLNHYAPETGKTVAIVAGAGCAIAGGMVGSSVGIAALGTAISGTWPLAVIAGIYAYSKTKGLAAPTCSKCGKVIEPPPLPPN